MATTVADLKALLTLDTSGMDTGVASVSGSSSKIKSALGIATGAATVAGTAILAVGAAALKFGSDWQQATSTIQTATGATGPALDALRASAVTVFETVPTDANTAAEAIGTLNTLLGSTGTELEGFTGQIIEASNALGEDAVANAEAFGQAVTQFGEPLDRAGTSLDFLFQMTQEYGTSLSGLLGNLNAYGAVLQNLGLSMTESAELFSRLSASGLEVSRMMPGINKAMRDFAEAGVEPKAGLEATFEAMKNATSQTEALNIATNAFGAEGAQRLTVAVRNGSLELANLATSAETADGAIMTNAENTRTLGDAWQLVTNNLSTALEPLGTALVGALQGASGAIMPLVELVGQAVQAFMDWFQNSTLIQGAIGVLKESFTSLGGSVGPLVAGFAKLVATLAGAALEVIIATIAVNLSQLAKAAKFVSPVLHALGNWWSFIADQIKKAMGWFAKLPGVQKIFGKFAEATTDLEDGLEGVGDGLDTVGTTLPPVAEETDQAAQNQERYNTLLEKGKQKLLKFDAQAAKHGAALIDSATAIETAREELEAFNQAWEDGTMADEAETLREKIDDIHFAAQDVTDIVVPAFMNTIPTAIGESEGKVGDLDTALEQLGITSSTEAANIVENMNDARDAVLGSAIATDFEKKTAIYKALKAQVDMAQQAGTDIPGLQQGVRTAIEAGLTGDNAIVAALKSQIATATAAKGEIPTLQADLLRDVKAKLENTSTGAKASIAGPFKSAFEQVSTSITNAAQNAIDALISGEPGSVKAAVVELGKGIVSTFTETALDAVKDFVAGAIEELLKKGPGSLLDSIKSIGDAFKGIFWRWRWKWRWYLGAGIIRLSIWQGPRQVVRRRPQLEDVLGVGGHPLQDWRDARGSE
jgi:TP901 family phage tail tape measure protein